MPIHVSQAERGGMMFVEAPVIVAVLADEPEGNRFAFLEGRLDPNRLPRKASFGGWFSGRRRAG